MPTPAGTWRVSHRVRLALPPGPLDSLSSATERSAALGLLFRAVVVHLESLRLEEEVSFLREYRVCSRGTSAIASGIAAALVRETLR